MDLAQLTESRVVDRGLFPDGDRGWSFRHWNKPHDLRFETTKTFLWGGLDCIWCTLSQRATSGTLTGRPVDRHRFFIYKKPPRQRRSFERFVILEVFGQLRVVPSDNADAQLYPLS